MTTCVSCCKYITLVCVTLQSVNTESTTHTSKACFGSPGLYCIRHYLSCSSNQKIAIVDAYYTDNTECGSGVAGCTLNPHGVAEHGYHRFSNAELFPLYNRCSTQIDCVYPAPRRNAALTFSVVIYKCIERNESISIDNGIADGVFQVSIISGDKWRHWNSSTLETNKHTCRLQPSGTDGGMLVYTLDARLRRDLQQECLSQLTVKTGNVIATNNCNKVFQPFMKLNISENLPISITFVDTHRSATLLWLLLNASTPFNIKCDHVQVQTKGTRGLTTTTSNMSATWITEEGTTTTAGQIETTTNTGAIIGGVVVTVLAASVATFVLVRLIRKRRQRMHGTDKKTLNPRVVKTDNTYCMASNIPQSNDNDRGSLKAQNTPSDYDYATVDGMAPLPDTYPTSVPAGRSNTSDSAAFVTDCDYDQFGDKPAPLTSTYDTTASVTQPTSTEGRIGEDEYGYNLFQKTTTETFQNDYDTAASATKAVTQLSRIVQNPDEDNYDHFSRGTTGSNTLGSPYDTAGNM